MVGAIVAFYEGCPYVVLGEDTTDAHVLGEGRGGDLRLERVRLSRHHHGFKHAEVVCSLCDGR